MINRDKRSILGVNISVLDYDAAVHVIVKAAIGGVPFRVSALAVHGVMTGALDPVHRFRLNRFDMLTPDGQPVRWVLRFLYDERLEDRVYGPELMLKVCEAASESNLPVFLFGNTQDVLADLCISLVETFPKLIIAGNRPSVFRALTEHENAGLVDEIVTSGARICFVGLGCPRQEVFVFENSMNLSMPMIAVGAAFDFHSGRTRQAPGWMQRSGIEWVFRLAMDPNRLWKRYILLNPLFIFMVFAQLLGVYNPSGEQKPSSSQRYG